MVLLTIVLACASRRADGRLERALAAVDRAWAAVPVRGLEPVDTALVRAERMGGDVPEVTWRRARYHLGVASASEGTQRVRALAEARAVAVGCLEREPDFRAQRDGAGWTEALATVPAVATPCVLMARDAWIAWRESVGQEASAVDAPAVEALSAY